MAIGTDGEDPPDLWELADESRGRGFFLQPQLSVAGLHVTLTGVSGEGVNRLLDGLPPQLRDRLATRFLSALYSPYLDAPGG
ncbi:hypothetical protein AB0O31_28710 [Kitasatospora cineracea]|uniref:hypothetical protein n=1 Tax=Kitasatospora cineracea TaxID=88074 RepID=UPI003430969F